MKLASCLSPAPAGVVPASLLPYLKLAKRQRRPLTAILRISLIRLPIARTSTHDGELHCIRGLHCILTRNCWPGEATTCSSPLSTSASSGRHARTSLILRWAEHVGGGNVDDDGELEGRQTVHLVAVCAHAAARFQYDARQLKETPATTGTPR